MPQELLKLIRGRERFVLTTHARPDGDAIGSELGMAHWLKKIGKTVTVLNTDPMPYNLEWLPGAGSIDVFDGSMTQREAIDKADVIMVMDTNVVDRLGSVGRAVQHSAAVKVLIDHHTAPETWFDLEFRSETVSSTGQLVHELITADDPTPIDADIATPLYAAIMTDTGSFRFSNVTPAVHRVIADLLERGGLDPSVIHAELYDKRSFASLRLLSRVLDTVSLSHGGQIAHMVVAIRSLQDTGAPVEETDGFVNWGLSVDGVRVSLIFTETERGTKVSFRSKADDHVHKWAQALGGGGHPNASGAFIRKPLQVTIDKVLKQAERYISLEEDEAEHMPLSKEDAELLASMMMNKQPRRYR